MATSDTTRLAGRGHAVLDVIFILALSLVAEAGYFSVRQGRAIISGDSAQHVDGAEALLSADRTPNFAFRKPGYTLMLAGLAMLTGNMSWSAVVANHLLLALLPVAAYGFGCNLRGRGTGWIAAILTIAQLQVALWGGRIMTEALYTCLISFGMLLLAVGLSRSRIGVWMLGAGLLLACAWLTRAVGVALVAGGVATAIWSFRRDRRRAITACACLALPVLGAFLLEGGLNYQTAGRFRTSTGGFGIMLLTRARYYQDSPFPDSDTTARMLHFLPERGADVAFMANELDGCIARCHAIRDEGMDEWTFNQLATRSATEVFAAHPKAYLKAGVFIFVRHLLRRTNSPPASWISHLRREPVVVHPAARDFPESQSDWFGFWFLPHRSVDESKALVARMRAAAEQRAPFGRSGCWAALRYITILPVVIDSLGVLRSVASLWPGFALLFCGSLGLNRRTCGLLAAAYVLEALLIAVCASADTNTARYQFVWLATDTALVACLATPVLQNALAYLGRVWRRHPASRDIDRKRLQETLPNNR